VVVTTSMYLLKVTAEVVSEVEVIVGMMACTKHLHSMEAKVDMEEEGIQISMEEGSVEEVQWELES